ncbi:MAG: MASE4 domain-containing protein, partial [Candidatus Eremiobacteraeota bacterium]|nr:MASE4 domain-containing protein [Candidatus Eremiobacteraeota bacterium]
MKSAAPRLASPEVASILGLGEGAHSHIQRWFAVAICFVLTVVAVLAIRYGSIQGPELKPFLPIAATTWALADLMTAFLLFAQFYLNGTTGFLVLGAAYAVSGLLTWPYLLEFPG